MIKSTFLKISVATAIISWTSANALPFIISDPVATQATHCGFKLDSGTRTNIPVVTEGASKICKMDVGSVTVGSHTIDATAVPVGSTTYTESVPSAPFTFSRPAVPNAPSALALVVISGKPTVQSAAVSTGVTLCGWVVDGGVRTDFPIVTGKCSLDVSALSSGSHAVTATAVTIDSIWGRLESASSGPFTYIVPTQLQAPSGLDLRP